SERGERGPSIESATYVMGSTEWATPKVVQSWGCVCKLCETGGGAFTGGWIDKRRPFGAQKNSPFASSSEKMMRPSWSSSQTTKSLATEANTGNARMHVPSIR